MRVSIVDYGMGNLTSVANAVVALGGAPALVRDAAGLRDAERIILPGVGAFGEAMSRLEERGLVDALREEAIERKKPFLGICLGMQLLATRGFEHGDHRGLGWIDGEVRAIATPTADLRVPHMGWNSVHLTAASPITRSLKSDSAFYFVHSFHFVPDDRSVVLGETDYGTPLVAIIGRENVFGTQFHPEKSHRAGIALLKSFLGYEGSC